MLRKLLVFSLFLLLSTSLQAATVTLTDAGEGRFSLGGKLEVLEDPAGNLTLADVQTPEHHQRFIPSNKEIPNYGFTSSVYWAYIKLQNDHTNLEEWLLELAYPLIDQVEVWVKQQDGSFKKHITGDKRPFAEREMSYHNFLFHLHLDQGEETEIYFRFKTESSMQMPLTLWSNQGFTEVINQELYGVGIYYGIMLSMIFYNLFIYLSVLDESYLNYVLYIIFYVMLQMSLNGFAYEYLWPNLIWWANVAVPITIAAALIFALRFAQTYLNVAEQMPKTHKVMWGMIVVLSIAILVALFAPYKVAIKLSTGVAVLTVVVIASTGVRSWRKGYRPAVYYLLAWSSILAGAMAFALKSFGVLPAMFLTNNGMQVGSALEVLLLSLGLADRINVMRKEKYLAEKEAREASQRALDSLRIADAQKEENLRIISEHNHTLEGKVAERTAAIKDLMDNTGQGFLSFGGDLKIQKEYSKACESFLGTELGGKHALEVMFANSETHPPAQVQEIIEMIFGGTDMMMVQVLLPERIEFEGAILSLEFKVMQGADTKIMVIMTDITKELALAAQLKSDEERQAVIVKVALDKNGFIQFLREVDMLISSVNKNLHGPIEEFDMGQVLRDYHTIKGGCASYAIAKVAHKAHEIEDRLVPVSKGDANLTPELLQELKTETNDMEHLLQEILTMLGDIIPAEERNSTDRIYRVPNSKIVQLEDFMLRKIGQEHLAIIKQEIDKIYAQPIAPLFRKYATAAEDLGIRLNKQVQVEIRGGEVEVPYHKLDHFFAAFIHLVRNSVDHGLEETDVREMLGKQPTGNLLIEAKQGNGELILRVQDDGGGIDSQNIISIAQSKGLLNEEQAKEISEQAALGLLFEPGFSTKEEVSDVSGRGVGMDAVRTAVEELAGKISIQTKLDEGTTFEIKIPLAS